MPNEWLRIFGVALIFWGAIDMVLFLRRGWFRTIGVREIVYRNSQPDRFWLNYFFDVVGLYVLGGLLIYLSF